MPAGLVSILAVVAALMAALPVMAQTASAGPGEPALRLSETTVRPGQSFTVSPSEPCRPGFGLGVRVTLTAPDGAAPISLTDVPVNSSTGRWGDVRLQVPPGAGSGSYRVSATCGLGDDTTPVTQYTSYADAFVKVADCSVPLFLGLRGSGEEQYGARTTETGMGPLIDGVYRDLSRRVGKLETIARHEQILRYEAVKVGDWRYSISADAGARLVLEKVQQKVALCGTSARIVMAGYSQGADGIDTALRSMSTVERNQVRAVVLFGSPVHTPFLNGDVGPDRGPGLWAPVPALPDGLPKRMQDYCNVGDMVCSTTSSVGQAMKEIAKRFGVDSCRGFCPHTQYEVTSKARAVAYLAGRL